MICTVVFLVSMDCETSALIRLQGIQYWSLFKIHCERLLPILNHKSTSHRHIIIGISSAGDHTLHNTSLKLFRLSYLCDDCIPKEAFVCLYFSTQVPHVAIGGKYMNQLLSIRVFQQVRQQGASFFWEWRKIMGCVRYHPTHKFSNTWKLLSIQELISELKGIRICTERGRVCIGSPP